MSTADALGLAIAALVPVAVLALTSFVKVSLVLGLLRNAFGTPEAPSSLVILGISLVLTGVAMAPVASEMIESAGRAAKSPPPAAAGQAWRALASPEQQAKVTVAVAALEPLVRFAARHAGVKELETFAALRGRTVEETRGDLAVVAPAFIATELARAFAMAVLLLLPFLVIDLVVGLALAALGAGSLSPQVVALPLKLLLFVAVDGWRLLLAALLRGYA